MKKRVLAVLLAAVMIFGNFPVAFAAETNNAQAGENVLQFNADGSFKIALLCDIHGHYPLEQFVKRYIVEMLQTEQPDLVILGGDIAPDPEPEKKIIVIKELCDMFADSGTYFTLVLGNHDNEGQIKEEFIEYFIEYGRGYFLGSDAVPALTGVGTHDLQILSSSGSKTAFNLFMFDSGSNVYDENGNNLGYDSVHTDQIEWYKGRVSELKAANGGKVVPSMVFQHIIVQEIDDALFYPVEKSAGELGEDFYDKHYLFTPIPKIGNITSGVLLEKPCPGYYNFGQLDAMKECGDVIAVFSGHDHSNTFTVNIDGIDVVNSGGCKRMDGFRFFTCGARIINLNEANPTEYESHILSFIDLGGRENSEIFDSGEISGSTLFFAHLFGKFFDFVMALAGASNMLRGGI